VYLLFERNTKRVQQAIRNLQLRRHKADATARHGRQNGTVT
jgi:hypothetical protein